MNCLSTVNCFGQVFFADFDIAVAGNAGAAFAIEGFVDGLPGSEAVDVAVVHAEGGGDQDRVVNFEIGGAFAAGGFDVRGGDEFAVLLHFAGNRQQGFELGRNGGLHEIGLDLLDQRFVAA